VTLHVHDLKTYAHDVSFNATVTERGEVQGITLHSSTLHHQGIESCAMQALASLPIPLSVFPLRSSEPVSGGESMRYSREPLGVVQAAGGVIMLGPIIIIAAGVTLGVYILAVATEETIEAATRKRKIDQACNPPFNECLGNQKQPDWNIGDFGTGKDCLSCLWECRAEGGIWPNYKCPRLNYRPN
jgi:hypothetical protein